MQIHPNFVPNIFFAKLVKYFWIYLQKTWRAGQVILKFGMLSNEVVLRKKLETKFLPGQPFLVQIFSKYFHHHFHQKKNSENIWNLALGF